MTDRRTVREDDENLLLTVHDAVERLNKVADRIRKIIDEPLDKGQSRWPDRENNA